MRCLGRGNFATIGAQNLLLVVLRQVPRKHPLLYEINLGIRNFLLYLARVTLFTPT